MLQQSGKTWLSLTNILIIFQRKWGIKEALGKQLTNSAQDAHSERN